MLDDELDVVATPRTQHRCSELFQTARSMTMKITLKWWKFVVRHRWRTVATVAAALTFVLFAFGTLWTPVDVDSAKHPCSAAATDVEAMRQLLRHSVDDERGTWPCANATDCRLTPSLLATTSAARPSVYSRTGLDCLAMFHGHTAEIEAARQLVDTAQTRSTTSDVDLSVLAGDCAAFRRSRGYFSQPLSRGEADFPIAFSILTYDNIPQVERLLRAIYMPQNFYCIHVDSKSPRHVHQAAAAIANCFDNVFIASRLESVYWGHISIVYAEMNCLRDLLRFKWKYFINLSGFMFPAHSNRELVEILRLYDGANDVEGSFTRSNHFLMRIRTFVSWRLSETFGMNILTLYPKSKTPYNVTVYKGSNQAALTRAFVLYFLYSRESANLLRWFSDTLAPDEYIWPTLNHNPQLHAPGSYKGDPETKPFTARASIWSPIAYQAQWSWTEWECQGQWVREICIFGVGDLPWLYRRPELFVNKFYAGREPLAYDCMEELIYNRTVMEAANDAGLDPTYLARFESSTFDPTYYLKLPFVGNKSTSVVSLQETLRYLH